MSDADQLAFEVQGGTVRPGYNQLEGTASDWNTIQNFAWLRAKMSRSFSTVRAHPLYSLVTSTQVGFITKHKPAKSHIYSWVLNNYWTTNFKANQEGEMNWNYVITSTPNTTNTAATRFGWENTIPWLPASSLPVQKSKTLSRSLIDLDLPNVLVVDSQLARMAIPSFSTSEKLKVTTPFWT